MLSLNAPTVSFDEDADNRELRIQTEESPDALSRLQSVEIERSRDGGETWSALERDDRGTEISVAERSYSFQTSGKYRVRVTDAFRTGPDSATVEFDYTQPPPVFSLTGADDRGYTDRSVRFTWSDDATVSVTKNGTAITYRSGDPLTEDGVYLITVENMDGYRKTLSFTIDTVPPELLLTGVSDGIAVNREVTVECPEENAVIEVLLEGTSLDCTERPLRLTKPGVYTVSAWDPAGNRNTASFQIVVDVTFPTLRLSGVSDGGITKKAVVLSEPSEEAVLKVYLEDEEIPYRYGDRLTGAGHYRVILTDEHGNESVYTFEIRKSANGAVIALVAVGGIAMVGIGAFLFLKKRKII